MKLTKIFDVNYFKNARPFDPNSERVWSHKYQETWLATELYCPACGKQEIWTEQSPGDYYVGSQSLCAACGATHYLDGTGPTTNDQDLQRLGKLRT